MFTEYHLEKIIDAINGAEERQTKAIVDAIKKIRIKDEVTVSSDNKDAIKDAIDLFLDHPNVDDRIRERLRGVKFESTPNQDSVFNKPDDKKEPTAKQTMSKMLIPPKKSTTTRKPTGAKR